MGINGAFRFLICISACLLWVGALATADEQSATDEEQTPPVAVVPPASSDDDAAAEEGEGEEGEAPAEESEEGS